MTHTSCHSLPVQSIPRCSGWSGWPTEDGELDGILLQCRSQKVLWLHLPVLSSVALGRATAVSWWCSAALCGVIHTVRTGLPANSSWWVWKWIPSSVEPLADILTNNSWKALCQEHPSKLFPYSWPTGLWDNGSLLFWATNLRNCLLCSDR